MISVSVKGVLVGILLIALIVLVVFLIVLVSNLTDTIKKANAIIDGGTNAVASAAASAKERSDKVNNAVKAGAGKVNAVKDKVYDVAAIGRSIGENIVERIVK